MKKCTSTLLVVFLLHTTTATAQVLKFYALKGGIDAATQNYDFHDHPYFHGSLNTSYRWGFTVGGELGFIESPMFSMSVEAIYIQKGYSIPLEVTSPAFPEGDGEPVTVSPRFDYVSIAPIARIALESIRPTPYVLLSPRLDILLGQSQSDLDFSSPDIGVTMGMGVQFSTEASLKLFIEGRYSPALSEVYHGQYATVKNKSFELLTGVRL